MATLPDLLSRRSFVGKVEWIGIASRKSGVVEARESIDLITGAGISGEHHYRENSRSKRQVTLIQHEHLAVVAAILGKDDIDPADLRRNIVVSGINLASLNAQSFSIGEAVLKGTGECAPCSLMEETLGAGGYAAMMAHGGITCVVESGGALKVGDSVELCPFSDV